MDEHSGPGDSSHEQKQNCRQIHLDHLDVLKLPGKFILDLVWLDRRKDLLQERKFILPRILPSLSVLHRLA
jgi:hypothetical protein